MRERSPRSERGRGTEDGLPDYSELCVGETRLASHEDLDSLDSLTGEDESEGRRAQRRPVLARAWRCLRHAAKGVIAADKPAIIDLELPQRYRPNTIAGLCEATGFSPQEVKRMYWSFKNECPTGLVTQETFHAVFSKFFPIGANLSSYSNYIFGTMDPDRTGVVTFEDFAAGLAVLQRGSFEEKLRWMFSLYDINKDGVLSPTEIREVTASVYDLMGHPGGERERSEAAEQHITRRADLLFQRLDLDSDGVVSLEEFLTTCQQDPIISQSVQALGIWSQ